MWNKLFVIKSDGFVLSIWRWFVVYCLDSSPRFGMVCPVVQCLHELSPCFFSDVRLLCWWSRRSSVAGRVGPTTPACTWWNHPEEDPSSGKLSQLIHPGPSSCQSSQLYAATLTHYSTEPLTTGPDYDQLLLLLALASDVHPNPWPSRYPSSVCFKNVKVPATCVQDARIGYIQDVLVFETLRIIVKPMAGSVPPVWRHHSHAHLPHLVPPTCPRVQAHGTIEKSNHPELHHSTTGSTHRPRSRLTV